MDLVITSLLGMLTGMGAYSYFRKRWVKATTEHRQHNFNIAVDTALERVLQGTVKEAIAQYMGSLRREFAEVLEAQGRLENVAKNAVSHAVTDRERLGDVKLEIRALREAVEQQARTSKAQADSTASLAISVARLATALGA